MREKEVREVTKSLVHMGSANCTQWDKNIIFKGGHDVGREIQGVVS